MFSENDQGKGVVRTCWKNIHKRIEQVEPEFAKYINKLSPDDTFPIYLSYHTYGSLKGDPIGAVFQDHNGNSFRLKDKSLPKKIFDELGYGAETSPFGMILDKDFEYFIDLPGHSLTIPRAIFSPGRFFSLSRHLSNSNKRIYSSNAALTVSAGARSVFMLPNIGCNVHHNRLKKDFNFSLPPAKKLYQHWQIFKELVNNEFLNCDWSACVIYFSKKWIDKIHNDPAWLPVRCYLYERAWHDFAFDRNRLTYDTAFSIVQKKSNLKPNPYLVDTAKHLLTVGLGVNPGHAPIIEEKLMPVSLLQKVFIDIYGLKKYPTIMGPVHFDLDENNGSVYYSLQNPTTHIFSPKSRTGSSTLFEIRELQHIMNVFIKNLSKDDGICQGTILNKAASILQFKYFHNLADSYKVILSSELIPNMDERFNYLYGKKCKDSSLIFAKDSKFFRGCISISKS